MLLGTALTAAAFGLIILPQGFAAGGVTGFCGIVGRVLPLPLAMLVLIVNVSLLILGLAVAGRGFAAGTVAVSLVFPALLAFFSRYPLYFLMQDRLLAALLAGLMLGAGAGLILRSGASSGGFDILAVVLNRRLGLPVAAVMRACDAAVILMQAMENPPINTMYGLVVIIVSAAVVSRLTAAGEASRGVPAMAA